MKGKLARILTVVALGLMLAAGSVSGSAGYVLVDLIDWFNNDGISWDEWPGDQNLDGGGWGFPAEELPDGDFEVAWDAETLIPFFALYKEDGWGNNVEAEGQTIELPQGNYTGAWILAVHHHGASTGAPSRSTTRMVRRPKPRSMLATGAAAPLRTRSWCCGRPTATMPAATPAPPAACGCCPSLSSTPPRDSKASRSRTSRASTSSASLLWLSSLCRVSAPQAASTPHHEEGR